MAMNYITTYSKIHFTPTSPKREDVRIEDIAHALSLLCRANGHICRFFSVAQHSINCAREAGARGGTRKLRLACLLHDASEAYLSDITRPVKGYLKDYLEYEAVLQSVIYDKFLEAPLDEGERKEVKRIDDAMLHYEFLTLMGETVFDTEPEIGIEPCLETRDFLVVERQFLQEFRELTL